MNVLNMKEIKMKKIESIHNKTKEIEYRLSLIKDHIDCEYFKGTNLR